MMKVKIEQIANVAVILLALVVGSVFLKDRLLNQPQSKQMKVGDKLPNLDGWDWTAHEKTLVLVLRKGCHFCEDSAPFYQRLAVIQKRDGSTSSIVAVFPDSADVVQHVVQSEGLEVQTLSGVSLEELKISGTPTLLLVDKRGMVLNAWIGVLSPRQELEVIKAMVCANGSCQESS
jgi:thioredoxin-related protein